MGGEVPNVVIVVLLIICEACCTFLEEIEQQEWPLSEFPMLTSR